MDARSLTYIAEACGGELVETGERLLISRICTDSRKLEPGDLFIALQGDKYDGHDFVEDVLRRGAAAVMMKRSARRPEFSHSVLILVDNTRVALGKLAARYRRDFTIPVVAVAGSNGKTTTKELIATLLAERFAVVRSQASFNNDIGVPLTLLNLEQCHQAAVLEVGTNHPGELAPLVSMARAEYGVITSIGREHLEFFKDLAGVVEEEGWLAELLPAHGKLYLNGDCQEMATIVRRTRARVVRAGFSDGNDWRARVTGMSEGGVRFRVDAPDASCGGEYKVGLLGRHQVVNALLAMAVARDLGLSAEELRRGLEKCVAPKMRLQLWESNGVQVLDDSYNANADSMKAALQTLHDLPCRGRRIAVLGDMAELGQEGGPAHVEVGRHAAALGVGQLFAVGAMAAIMARAARESGLMTVSEFRSVEEAGQAVREFVKPGDLVLLKASRSTRLERISEMLRRF